MAPPTPEIYTLSLHDALPICDPAARPDARRRCPGALCRDVRAAGENHLRPHIQRKASFRDADLEHPRGRRSEEHTSELQSHSDLVCRLLLEKKKKKNRREINE